MEEKGCIHYWIITDNKGSCRKCGEERIFTNEIITTVWRAYRERSRNRLVEEIKKIPLEEIAAEVTLLNKTKNKKERKTKERKIET